jgi:ATPase subunit of ABC transporter with duplicated ATPase domains
LCGGVRVACLIVSHDASFLQATIDVVFELDAVTKTLRSTTSSFEDYIVARDVRRQMAADAEESRQKRAANLEAEATKLRIHGAAGARHVTGDSAKLLRDFRRDRAGRSMHAAGVKARAKQRVLEEERDTDVPGDLVEFDLESALQVKDHATTNEDGEPTVQLDQDHALSLIDAQFGYALDGEKPRTFGPLSITVNVGERVLLLGRNGSGKSSTLAALAGTLPLSGGVREAGRGVRIGVLHQDADCGLDTSQTVIATMEAATEARKFKRDGHFSRLRHIGISHTAALRPIAQLSPGLIVRLALLLLVLRGVNMLVLDEVTNFIDRAAKETLLDFLPTFSGAIVCVTHDRELMESIHWTAVQKVRDDGTSLEAMAPEALEQEMEERSKEADEAISILLD